MPGQTSGIVQVRGGRLELPRVSIQPTNSLVGPAKTQGIGAAGSSRKQQETAPKGNSKGNSPLCRGAAMRAAAERALARVVGGGR
jgi:hypothetical protein